MSATVEPEAGQFLELPGPFPLESGAKLPSVTVAYRTWGRLNASGDNAVLVCHGLTGSADVERWWSPLLGPQRALDPTRDFVVCSNVLGGCSGTTGPSLSAPTASAVGAALSPQSRSATWCVCRPRSSMRSASGGCGS